MLMSFFSGAAKETDTFWKINIRMLPLSGSNNLISTGWGAFQSPHQGLLDIREAPKRDEWQRRPESKAVKEEAVTLERQAALQQRNSE